MKPISSTFYSLIRVETLVLVKIDVHYVKFARRAF